MMHTSRGTEVVESVFSHRGDMPHRSSTPNPAGVMHMPKSTTAVPTSAKEGNNTKRIYFDVCMYLQYVTL